MAAALYALILVLLSPVFLLGYAVWVGAMLVRRSSGASATAQAPLFARWVQDRMGTRRDEGARRLLPVVPGVPAAAWRLVGGPLLLAHRVSGYVPRTFRYPFEGQVTLGNQGGARQTFYDRVVERFLPDLEQFVVLGAGFDTRTVNLPDDTSVRAFEVDTPATVVAKRGALARAGVDTSGVMFVGTDFEAGNWLAILAAAGFDPARPALFIWEGVTPYLHRNAVLATLRTIAGLAAGTVVAFDHFTSEVTASGAPAMRAIRASLRAGGEPLRFGIDSTPPLRDRVEELLESCGLALVEQRTLGDETSGRRAWGGVVVATVR